MAVAADLTTLLARARAGDGAAAEAVFAATYDELRQIAHARLSGDLRHTLLDTTALVHEWFLKFCRKRRVRLADRAQFMRYAARAMRTIIVDFARDRPSPRRSDKGARQGLVLVAGGGERHGPEEILAVHRALEALARFDRRMADVVELRYFGGLSEIEIGE